jgi:predicted ATPase
MIALIGRKAELACLKQHLADAIAGKGSTILISGEPGIGKTALVEAFKEYAATQDVKILSGAASADSAQPFLVFSKALVDEMDAPLFEEQEYTQFVKIFAINPAGMLVAEASSGEGDLDADIFAGMLSAVQNFVGDSLDTAGEQKSGLGRLEYGDMKILIEHGQHLFLTGVFSGGEHPDMKGALKRALQRIEEEHGAALERWSGKVSEVEAVREIIEKLADAKFLVRRDLTGVKLENERIRIADEIFGSLRAFSAERTLVVLLEDIHWVDESSLFVLSYLARNIGKDRILLMGTSRPCESESLQRVIENMMNDGVLHELAMEKLDMESMSSLIHGRFFPNDFPPAMAERLYEQSDGNPLFAIEMLKEMHREGNIAKTNGKYSLVSEFSRVPATVEEVVRRRIDALDPDSIAMAEYASCIGQRFDQSLPASNRLLNSPEKALRTLLVLGILHERNGVLEFSHAVFQSVIYEGIGERWKAVHHRNLGEHLERVYSGRLDEVIYDLARHFSISHEHTKCSDYCIKAGEKAESAFAVEQALAFYNVALSALSKTGNSVRERVMEILERAGDLQTIMGNYEEAIGSYLSAHERANDNVTQARMMRKCGDVHLSMGNFDSSLEYLSKAKATLADASPLELGRILVGEGTAYWRKGNYNRSMSLFEEALGLLGKADKIGGDCANVLRMIGRIHLSKGEYDEALEYQMKSLDLAERAGHKIGVAASLNNIGIVHYDRDDLDLALEYHERSLQMKEKIGDKQGVAMSLNNIGLVHWAKGETDKALECYNLNLEISEKIGDKRSIGITLNNIGALHYDRGELDLALTFYQRSLASMEKIGNNQNIATLLMNLGIVHYDRGELDLALEFHGRSLEIRRDNDDKEGIAMSLSDIGAMHYDRGELDLALEHYQNSLAICLEIGVKRLSIRDYCGMAEVELAKGGIENAHNYAETALGIAIELRAKAEEAMSRRVLGICHRKNGEWEKARTEFRSAETLLREIGDNNKLIRLFYEYAVLFKGRCDTANAREYLERSLAEFEKRNMRLWADKCRKALEELEQ